MSAYGVGSDGINIKRRLLILVDMAGRKRRLEM
jgi:hypothetical protein